MIGCVPLPAGPAAQDDRTTRQATPIARLELEAGHVIEFYELSPGHVAMFEQGSLDRQTKPVDRDVLAGLSMPMVHARLAPGQPVPAAVLRAEQRRLTDDDASAKAPRAAGLHVVSEPPGPVPSPGGRGPSATTPDAAWWRATFCSAAHVDKVWCATNVPWAHSGWRRTMYYDVTGMSGSRLASTRFWVEQYTTAWTRVLAVSVEPRSWWRWTFDGEATFRSGIDGLAPESRAHFSERYRLAITGFANDHFYPRAAEWQFNNDIQGVTHDANNWYFTRTIYPVFGAKKGVIAKASMRHDLRNQPPLRSEEPFPMTAFYNHYGDLTHRNGLLYVAIDGRAGAGVGVFTTNLGAPVGWHGLPGLSSCPWIAYNPRDDLFYVPDGSKLLRRYAITVAGNSVTPVEVLPRITLSTDITNQQGGDFSSRGVLYISRGYKSNPMAVYGVDVANGRVYERVRYEAASPDQWEAEGVTIWDLTTGLAPGIRGHLHLQLLDNDTDNDDFTFAHLTATDPSRL